MTKQTGQPMAEIEQRDLVIIGAGLSGIGAACHLVRELPGKSFTILEGRENLGGTWDLFRYPGIRSDSDMFTLGYNFKPWTSAQSLADGPAIRNYIKEAAQEHRVEDKIRFNAQVKTVEWDSASALWTITYEDKKTGQQKQLACNFILSCTGYYNYAHGHEPEFKGRENFKGQVIHPQKWPEDLDYSGKKVVVIGSGATAVTLVPEMTDKAGHVTMLQRSPTYMGAVPEEDKLINKLREHLPDKWVYRLARAEKIAFQYGVYNISQTFPKQMRKILLSDVKRQVGSKVDMKHFKPSYNPWDERLCAVKSGDLFKALREGKASIVTDHIDHFTENGIKLKSGDELPADIIITATGLDMQFFGGIDIVVDGEAFEHTEKMSYKGLMLERLPNIGFTFGYTNASWTLKADLTSEYFCRLIRYMDRTGKRQVMPVNDDPKVKPIPFADLQSGYVQRALHKFPNQGSKFPWKLYQSYPLDLLMLRYGKLKDKALKFSRPSKAVQRPQPKAKPALSAAS